MLLNQEEVERVREVRLAYQLNQYRKTNDVNINIPEEKVLVPDVNPELNQDNHSVKYVKKRRQLRSNYLPNRELLKRRPKDYQI